MQISVKQCEADPDMLCKVRSDIFSDSSMESMFEMETWGTIVQLFETWISELIQAVP